MKDTTNVGAIEFMDGRDNPLKGDYQRLAQLRFLQTKPKHIPATINTQGAFVWSRTPEGKEFWLDVQRGRNPAIPSKSLKELGD